MRSHEIEILIDTIVELSKQVAKLEQERNQLHAEVKKFREENKFVALRED